MVLSGVKHWGFTFWFLAAIWEFWQVMEWCLSGDPSKPGLSEPGSF